MTARLATPDDNDLLLSIVEHPALRAATFPDTAGKFDPNNFTRHPNSFALVVDGGCFLAMATEWASYVVHTNFLPEARGANAMRESQDALRFAFLATPAEDLHTMVPAYAMPTRWFAHRMGFKDTYIRPNAWLHEGVAYDLQHMRLDLDDWIMSEPACRTTGAQFHADLGEGVNHAEDPVHDAFVGAAVLMVANGQPDKAVRTYGRWARANNYLPFTIAARDPLVLDIGSHLVKVEGLNYTILEKPCQQAQQQQ